MSKRKKVIDNIVLLDDVTDEEFLDECFGLGMVAQGIVQIEDIINGCECKDVDMETVKENFTKSLPGLMEKLKAGEIEEVYNDIRAVMLLYARAHEHLCHHKDENPFSMSGPLAGAPDTTKDLN
jgi:hypothetical protein